MRKAGSMAAPVLRQPLLLILGIFLVILYVNHRYAEHNENVNLRSEVAGLKAYIQKHAVIAKQKEEQIFNSISSLTHLKDTIPQIENSILDTLRQSHAKDLSMNGTVSYLRSSYTSLIEKISSLEQSIGLLDKRDLEHEELHQNNTDRGTLNTQNRYHELMEALASVIHSQNTGTTP